jgi:hypothetical protein
MPDPQTLVSVGTTVAEGAFPVLIPFDPLIRLVESSILAHILKTQTWPTPEQIVAGLPADYQSLVQGWSSWKPSGDGTLKTQ